MELASDPSSTALWVPVWMTLKSPLASWKTGHGNKQILGSRLLPSHLELSKQVKLVLLMTSWYNGPNID